MSKEQTISERLKSLRQRYGFTQEELAEKMGFTRSYLSQLESESKGPGPKFLKALLFCEQTNNPDLWTKRSLSTISEEEDARVDEPPSTYGGTMKVRWIPLLSWAQAGTANDFEELPTDWQELIPTTVSNPQAFAIQLRGDSMEPEYKEGDIAVVLPGEPARVGDLVIAKIKKQGMVFKVFQLIGGEPTRVRLKSYNEFYEPMDIHRDDFHWIYPVDSVTKRVRR